ncbi:MAG: PCRF domain-containing protein [Candidatus Zambryskibacteria bacterium]|nr:PCRF domain-containing protein [Candidatus Zambryskibacteria bacterium]
MEKSDTEKRIKELEKEMSAPNFWQDKEKAQTSIKEFQRLKDKLEGVGQYDKGNAIMTIFSGAGGDDSEDFSAMLLRMYFKFFENRGWQTTILHENQNDHGGYRNVTVEITHSTHSARSGSLGPYGILKNESGVHRLVRISPFNANQKRHTSFSMIEVIPVFDKQSEKDIELSEKDLKIEFSRSSGPGGQNVNKRETSVRIVHLPTNLSAESDSERTQEANKEKALSVLRGKIFKALEEKRISKEEGMYVSKTTDIEWGNQIRSYVLHPYKMVKDHRTGVETFDVGSVLENGELDKFIKAEKDLSR